MSRIPEAFARLRREKRTGLVTYVTAGDPDLVRSADIIKALDRAGADVIEVGVPFSDPLADGLTNQLAAQRALDGGMTAARVFELVKRLREKSQVPHRASLTQATSGSALPVLPAWSGGHSAPSPRRRGRPGIW